MLILQHIKNILFGRRDCYLNKDKHICKIEYVIRKEAKCYLAIH